MYRYIFIDIIATNAGNVKDLFDKILLKRKTGICELFQEREKGFLCLFCAKNYDIMYQ